MFMDSTYETIELAQKSMMSAFLLSVRSIYQTFDSRRFDYFLFIFYRVLGLLELLWTFLQWVRGYLAEFIYFTKENLEKSYIMLELEIFWFILLSYKLLVVIALDTCSSLFLNIFFFKLDLNSSTFLKTLVNFSPKKLSISFSVIFGTFFYYVDSFQNFKNVNNSQMVIRQFGFSYRSPNTIIFNYVEQQPIFIMFSIICQYASLLIVRYPLIVLQTAVKLFRSIIYDRVAPKEQLSFKGENFFFDPVCSCAQIQFSFSGDNSKVYPFLILSSMDNSLTQDIFRQIFTYYIDDPIKIFYIFRSSIQICFQCR